MERPILSKLNILIAGVDEAGRGPLAGPVVAAAVILNPERPIVGLNDSKKLSPMKRERLYAEILAHSIAVGIGKSSVLEIDEINILQATMLAMQRAVQALSHRPQKVLIDGNRCPILDMPSQAIIGGDALEPAIMAASIIAKVTRDREMEGYEALYPGYGFAQHKGYGTALHLSALERLGVADCHRQSFAPIKLAILAVAHLD